MLRMEPLEYVQLDHMGSKVAPTLELLLNAGPLGNITVLHGWSSVYTVSSVKNPDHWVFCWCRRLVRVYTTVQN